MLSKGFASRAETVGDEADKPNSVADRKHLMEETMPTPLSLTKPSGYRALSVTRSASRRRSRRWLDWTALM